MRVLLSVDVTDEQRLALRKRENRGGLATRYEIRSLVEMLLKQELDEATATGQAPD